MTEQPKIQVTEPVKPTAGHTHAGVHYMAEFWGAEVIEDPARLSRLLHGAAHAGHSTVVREAMHAYAPHGITGFILLAESHLSLHTWPELDYIAVDIFTCGDQADGQAAIAYLEQELAPERVEIQQVRRGRYTPGKVK